MMTTKDEDQTARGISAMQNIKHKDLDVLFTQLGLRMNDGVDEKGKSVMQSRVDSINHPSPMLFFGFPLLRVYAAALHYQLVGILIIIASLIFLVISM